jgi:hypothetical protein
MFIQLTYNLLFIIGLNKATEYQCAVAEEKGQDYVDGHGIIKDSKYVLWFLRHWSVKYFGHNLSKPLFTCIPCMASVWGSVWYFATNTIEASNLIGWVAYVFILCGMGAIANRFLYGFH